MGEMIQRREVLKALGVLGAGAVLGPGLLSACSSSKSSKAGGPTSSAPAAGGSKASTSSAVTGSMAFWWNPSVDSAQAMTQWMDGVVKAFEAANPGTHIDSVTQPPEQMVGNFQAACQAKSGPSLQHEYSGPYTMQFVWNNCVAPLDDLVASQFSHVLPPAALDLYKYAGKTWALPWYNAPVVLMYNKGLFQKAGLDPEKPPTTLDDLKTAAAALKKIGVVPWGYGVKGLTGIGNFANLFNLQQLDDPKQILSVVLGQKSYTDPTYSGWLDWVAELKSAHVFNDDVTSLQYTDAMNMFSAKKSAICISSSLTTFQKALGNDLGIFTPPAIGTGKLAGDITFNSHPLFIPSYVKNTALPAAFLEYLHAPQNLTGMYKSSGFFPADDRFDSSVLDQPTDKQLFDFLAKKSTISYQNYWPSQMDRENLFIAVQAVFAGQQTPAQATAAVQKRLETWRSSAQADLKNFQNWASK